MRRFGMIGIGIALGIFLACLVLGLNVVRPPECGEPSACGDDYLFPALPISMAVLISTLIYAIAQSKWQAASWPGYLKRTFLWGLGIGGVITVFSILHHG